MLIIDRNTDINTVKYCPFCCVSLQKNSFSDKQEFKCGDRKNCSFHFTIIYNKNYIILGYGFALSLNKNSFHHIIYDFRNDEYQLNIYQLNINDRLIYSSKSYDIKLDLHNVVDIEKQIKLLLTFN